MEGETPELPLRNDSAATVTEEIDSTTLPSTAINVNMQENADRASGDSNNIEGEQMKDPEFRAEKSEPRITEVEPSRNVDAGVTVDDDDNRGSAREPSEQDQNQNNDEDDDSIIDIISESEVYEAAKQLLNTKAPQIKVCYKDEVFLLLGEYDGDNAKDGDNQQGWDKSRLICEDSADLHRGCNVVFGRIRLFLENLRGGLDLLSRELLMEFPDLDLVMEEDNMYNKDITMNDVVSIFKILKDNSIKKCVPDVPTFLTIDVNTRPRFVSRYNSLVELLSGDATFSNIQVFTNDKSHPVVLDDNEQAELKGTEVIVMSSDEEKDGIEESNDNSSGTGEPARSTGLAGTAGSVEPAESEEPAVPAVPTGITEARAVENSEMQFETATVPELSDSLKRKRNSNSEVSDS
ncbi:LANO_0D00518g1_1 [Lachancea nothofagi CBS 11611]|uniref:LANO_0D00518g1_1 n=1 Tax=Lachancea nothofagi CBS 11611 TaxID=1266666 RepID=A0A1G4JCR7_9SACH|nr:LANO_0D00518g1_1 [Lachancea nothofagi CBS 11611]